MLTGRERKLLWQLTSLYLGRCGDQRLTSGKGEGGRCWIEGWTGVIDGWMIGRWKVGKWMDGRMMDGGWMDGLIDGG